jgi:hypothetical protein
MVLAAVVMSSGAIRLMRSNEGSCLRVTYRVSSINSIVRADPLCSARVRSEVGAFDLLLFTALDQASDVRNHPVRSTDADTSMSSPRPRCLVRGSIS